MKNIHSTSFGLELNKRKKAPGKNRIQRCQGFGIQKFSAAEGSKERENKEKVRKKEKSKLVGIKIEGKNRKNKGKKAKRKKERKKEKERKEVNEILGLRSCLINVSHKYPLDFPVPFQCPPTASFWEASPSTSDFVRTDAVSILW